MKFLNLKKYANKYFNFIYNDQKILIYTTIREKCANAYFTICIYYIEENLEKIVKDFYIEECNYYEYKTFVKNNKIFIVYKERRNLKIMTIENFKLTNKENDYSMHLEGEIKHVNILDDNYLVVFIEKNAFLPNEYLKYRSSKSFSYKFSYLIDLKEERLYFIKDVKFALGARDYIFLTKIKGKISLFFEEAYREDWEKEFYYFKGLFDESKKIKENNSVNFISMDSFVKEIKSGKEILGFKEIDTIDKEGNIRYLGEDKDFIYYRKKLFKTGIENIYTINKTDETLNLKECIEHNKYMGEFYYNSDKITIFYEEEDLNYKHLIGILNRNCDVLYSEDIGMFEDFIEDRYLITYYWEDDCGKSYEYAVIKDYKENKEFQYEGFIRSFNNYVVLY